jgi:hypothetical protein
MGEPVVPTVYRRIDTLLGAVYTDGPWTQTRFSDDPSVVFMNPAGDVVPLSSIRRLYK